MKLNQSYVGSRQDILDIMPKPVHRVMDVGCSVGAFGEGLIRLNPNVEVFGIELQADMAEVAKTKLHQVHLADVEECSLSELFGDEFFDCIVFADVLEHLKDPWRIVSESVEALQTGGHIIACMPNVRHIDTIYNLVFRGEWPYRERGIHDRTHLRFFTRKNLVQLFDLPSLQIERIHTKYRILERPAKINKYASFFALPFLRNFLAFQYIFVVRKIEASNL